MKIITIISIILLSNCTFESDATIGEDYIVKKSETDQDITLIDKGFNGIEAIEGDWEVVEFLGESVEFHEAMEKSDEQKLTEVKVKNEIIEKYLFQTLKINDETVKAIYPPTEIGYDYVDWDSLYDVYRQPSDIWENISPPFICISFYHEDFLESFNIIIEENGTTKILVIDSLFFKLERAND